MRDHLRFAVRSLRRAPAFVAAALTILALGIGAATAVFSVADAVLVRQLPIHDQDHVIVLSATAPGVSAEIPTLLDRYERFGRSTATLSDVAGYAHYGAGMVPLKNGTSLLQAREALVTGNFFAVLGARPVVGRLLRPDDDVVGGSTVIVISEPYWRSTFGANPAVVGRHLRILNRNMIATVIGVAPAGLDYPKGADYWLPIVPSKYPAVDLIGRLRAGATPETARAEFAAFVANDTRAFQQGSNSLRASGADVHLLADMIVGPAREALIVLVIAVAGLLLVACVNVSNLLLVRATARSRELAVRRALGASSRQIAAQLGVEMGILAIVGSAIGCVVALLLLRLLVASAPPDLPRLDEITLSPGALGIAVAATIIALVVAGVVPAMSSGNRLGTVLRADSRSGADSRRRRTLRSAMVAAQLALALVLLAAAGLLGRSLFRLEGRNPGYVPGHLSIVQIWPNYYKYRSQEEFDQALDDVQRRLRAVPGVSAVSPVLGWPFQGTNDFAVRMQVRDRPDLVGANAPYVSIDAVGPDFPAAMDSPIVRGRGISGEDRAGQPRVAVVTQDLANLYWPGQDPLGKQLRYFSDTTWSTVVGVMRRFNYRTLEQSTPTVLFSYRQRFEQGYFVVRSSRDLAAILPDLRRAASGGDPDIILWRAESMEQARAIPLSRPRLEAFLVAMFAVVALLLAAVGLYAIMAFIVRQQTRELGVRIALGSTPRRIVGLALGNALRVAMIGAVVGLALALIAARMLSAELFDVSPTDPLVLVGASGVLMIVVVVAAYLPARRAARIDPVEALRAD